MLKSGKSPAVGELVLDAKRDAVGMVMDAQGGRMFLRPPEGGREWEASPDDVRPVPAREMTGVAAPGTSGASRRTL